MVLTSTPRNGELRRLTGGIFDGATMATLKVGDAFDKDTLIEYKPQPGSHGLPLDNFSYVVAN